MKIASLSQSLLQCRFSVVTSDQRRSNVVCQCSLDAPHQLSLNRHSCRKSSVAKCIFVYMALYFECRFNKNALLHCYLFGFFFSGWDIYKSMFFGVCWELFNHWGGKCLIIVLYYFKKLIKNIIENIFCLACLNRHLNIFVDVWVWKLADCLQPHEICLRLVFIVLHHLNRIGLSFRRNSSGDRRGRESHVDYHLSRSTLIESYLHIHWDLVAQNRRMQ